MTNKGNRKGYALGAIFALVASFFVGSMPAQAADATEGANIAIRPNAGPTTNFNGLVTEDFLVYGQLLPGITNANFATEDAASRVMWEVTETGGLYDLIVMASDEAAGATNISLSTTSRTVSGAVSPVSASADYDSSDTGALNVAYSDTSVSSVLAANTVTVSAPINATSGIGYLSIKALSSSAITSKSPNAVVTVRMWIDEQGGKNGVRDATEWYTEETVTLHATDNVPVAKTVTGIRAGSTKLTISSVVSALNFQNLGGQYFLYAEDVAGSDDSTASSRVTGTQMFERAGVLSASAMTLGTLNEGQAISVSAYYNPSGDSSTTASSFVLGTWTMGTVGSAAASAISLVVDNDGANVTASNRVRLNQTVTVKVGATTASGGTSVSAALVHVDFSGVTLQQFVKEIRINGGTWTSSLPTDVAVTTGADGWGSFTYETRGFVDGNDLTLDAELVANANRTATKTLQAEAAVYKVHNEYQQYSTTPGAAVSLGYTIRDQWNVLSSANHKLVFTRGGTGFNYAATVSELLTSNGRATLAFTPEAATATGSATVQADGYIADTNGNYVTTGMTDDSNITVYVATGASSFLTTNAIAGSYSTSVSYLPSSYSWTSAITGGAANTGSAVTVAASGVIFKDALGNTASDTMTVRVGTDQQFTVYATSQKSGTYTMTFTNGSSTTTSELIVSAPGSDQGVSIVWDTTEIQAGKTKVVTGTLLDAAGNPVYTDNKGSVSGDATTASILVSYTGTAGIPVGTMPTETDVDGKFRVSILTSAADSGTFTLTAVYSKDGTVTADDDKLTSVQTITVGEVAAAASDKKVNAGSFKGYVAVYAKGYEGQRLSAKVGNDWVVVASLASNFERVVEFTGAGYTIAVRIYIDRVLVDTITVTTK